MNNINSAENARAVVADVSMNRSGTPKQAATSEQTGGNTLPPLPRSDAPAKPKPVQEDSSAQRAARVEQAVEQLNDYAQSLQRDLRFSIDEDLGQAVVHVVDRSTQEVVRQIPNETAIELARNLKEQKQQVELQLQGGQSGNEAHLDLINTRI